MLSGFSPNLSPLAVLYGINGVCNVCLLLPGFLSKLGVLCFSLITLHLFFFFDKASFERDRSQDRRRNHDTVNEHRCTPAAWLAILFAVGWVFCAYWQMGSSTSQIVSYPTCKKKKRKGILSGTSGSFWYFSPLCLSRRYLLFFFRIFFKDGCIYIHIFVLLYIRQQGRPRSSARLFFPKPRKKPLPKNHSQSKR